MYTGFDYAWTAQSSGSVRSCHPFANLLGAMGGLYVDVCHDVCHPGTWVGPIRFASVVTRFRGPVSQSRAFLAGIRIRRVLLVVCLGIRVCGSPFGFICKLMYVGA